MLRLPVCYFPLRCHLSKMTAPAQKASLIARHILTQLSRHTAANKSLPLIVGVQGPQGSGKTTVTAAVRTLLEQEGKRTAVLSIDDLYLPHAGLEDLKRKFPANKLLHGRGQPGTHDMPLGSEILAELKTGKEGRIVHLPTFDKSQFEGEGDRSEATVDVALPLDVIIFEGWCMGFYPIDARHLEELYEAEAKQTGQASQLFFAEHSVENLLQLNALLQQYVEWYKHIDTFVLLRPDNLQNVFQWRLQAEHAMKATGKPGMSDEQVHGFVARYMPGYELFGEGPLRKDAPWAGHGLILELNAQRDLVSSGAF